MLWSIDKFGLRCRYSNTFETVSKVSSAILAARVNVFRFLFILTLLNFSIFLGQFSTVGEEEGPFLAIFRGVLGPCVFGGEIRQDRIRHEFVTEMKETRCPKVASLVRPDFIC